MRAQPTGLPTDLSSIREPDSQTSEVVRERPRTSENQASEFIIVFSTVLSC